MPDLDQLEEAINEAVATEDLNDDIKTQLEASINERFSGFQSVLDKAMARQEAKFMEAISSMQRSTLSPAELNDLEEAETAAKIKALERENAILKARKDHPDEVDFLLEFLSKENMQDQIKAVSEFRNRHLSAAEPTPSEELPEEVATSPVDMNNPKRKSGPNLGSLLKQGKMTKDQAAKILEAAGDEVGLLHRLRG